jgi:putative endonuclease
LKRWSRGKKIALIERMNPAWVDMSSDWFEYEPADFKRATNRILS